MRSSSLRTSPIRVDPTTRPTAPTRKTAWRTTCTGRSATTGCRCRRATRDSSQLVRRLGRGRTPDPTRLRLQHRPAASSAHTTPSSRPRQRTGGWCCYSHRLYNSYYGDYDVYVYSNQPDQSATASAGGHPKLPHRQRLRRLYLRGPNPGSSDQGDSRHRRRARQRQADDDSVPTAGFGNAASNCQDLWITCFDGLPALPGGPHGDLHACCRRAWPLPSCRAAGRGRRRAG